MYYFIDFLKEVVIPILLVIGLITAVVTTVVYYGSCKKANYYNKISGASYSCSDIFWAGRQIELMMVLNK